MRSADGRLMLRGLLRADIALFALLFALLAGCSGESAPGSAPEAGNVSDAGDVSLAWWRPGQWDTGVDVRDTGIANDIGPALDAGDDAADGRRTTSPPVLFALHPGDGARLEPNIVPISVECVPQRDVVVEFLLDGTLHNRIDSPPFVADWDASSVTSGPHTLTARATDPFGREDEVEATVQVEPHCDTGVCRPHIERVPDLTRGEPFCGSLLIAPVIEYQQAVTALEVQRGGEVLSRVGEPPWVATVHSENLAPGESVLRVVVFDDLGQSSSYPVVLQADGEDSCDDSPMLLIVTPESGKHVSHQVYWQVLAQFPVGMRAWLRFPHSVDVPLVTGMNDGVWPSSGLVDGNATAMAWISVDGENLAFDEVTFSLDRRAPGIVMKSPPAEHAFARGEGVPIWIETLGPTHEAQAPEGPARVHMEHHPSWVNWRNWRPTAMDEAEFVFTDERYEGVLGTDELPDGFYTLAAVMVDEAGNEGISRSSFILESAPRVALIPSEEVAYEGALEIAFEVMDDDPDLRAEVRVDGLTYGSFQFSNDPDEPTRVNRVLPAFGSGADTSMVEVLVDDGLARGHATSEVRWVTGDPDHLHLTAFYAGSWNRILPRAIFPSPLLGLAGRWPFRDLHDGASDEAEDPYFSDARAYVDGELLVERELSGTTQFRLDYDESEWTRFEAGEHTLRIEVTSYEGEELVYEIPVVFAFCADHDGDGVLSTACGGTDCRPDDGAATRNACGGCDVLAGEPGTPCGLCGSGVWVCESEESAVCTGARELDTLNACGGCFALAATPGEECETCDGDVCLTTCVSTDAAECRPAAPDGFVRIPSGRFVPGDPSLAEPGAAGVTIPYEFFMGAREITVGDLADAGVIVDVRSDAHRDQPMDELSEEEWAAYANARSRAEGLAECYALEVCSGVLFEHDCSGHVPCLRGFSCAGVSLNGVWSEPSACPGYRLATEVEWEWAARAGGPFASWFEHAQDVTCAEMPDWQRDVLDVYTNLCARAGPVEERQPNPWGLWDMVGNLHDLTFTDNGFTYRGGAAVRRMQFPWTRVAPGEPGVIGVAGARLVRTAPWGRD